MSEGRVFKIVLLGDGGVGKTSLVRQYVHKKFEDKYLKTLGTNIYKKTVEKKDFGGKVPISLQIWDVMGQNTFPQVIKTSLKGARGVVFVTDLTNEESLKNLPYWVDMVFKNTDDVAFVFLGNKSDREDIAFGFNSVKKVADHFYSPYYITSAKSGEYVDEVFEMMGDMIHNKRFVPESKRTAPQVPKIDIPKILIAEDNIINAFCNRMGGYEKAMPVIRKQFESLNIDFENPTKEQLTQLVKKLLEVMRHLTEEDIKRLQTDLLKYVQEA